MSAPPTPSPSSLQAMRAALIGGDEAGPPHHQVVPHRVVHAAPGAGALPTAPELLEASPNVQRLCESYHRTHRHMVARNRRQRLGLAVLVAAMGVAALLLARSHAVSVGVATDLVLAVGLASGLAIGLLALLWLRDDRRLRRAQGDRLLRALQFNCTLPEERLDAFRRSSRPTAAFFECYALWREQHPDEVGGIVALVRVLRGQGSLAA
jgi:hypothetical protein